MNSETKAACTRPPKVCIRSCAYMLWLPIQCFHGNPEYVNEWVFFLVPSLFFPFLSFFFLLSFLFFFVVVVCLHWGVRLILFYSTALVFVSSYFILFYFIIMSQKTFCLLMKRHQGILKGENPGEKESGGKLVGVEGRKTIIKIHYV